MNIPKHIGIIMDGNRRWAQLRGFPKIIGHKYGADNVVKIVQYANDIGIEYITLWALSSDNLKKREEKEIKGIIKLINSIEKYLEKMKINNLKFETIGDISLLPLESQEILKEVKYKTKNNDGITLILALVYGGQDEIVRATKEIIKLGITPNSLTREEFRKFLDSGKFPKVDLIIRTGGDIRHSGFLLYDSEYSEYCFSNSMWPEFSGEELKEIINNFSNRNRKFGK